MTGAAHDSITLVGREREQTALRDQHEAARTGRGGLVLIGGEAGIGKTALAESLCGEATEQGALVLIGRCYDLTETPPYGPWVDLFARYRPTDRQPPLPLVFIQPGAVGATMSQSEIFTQTRDFLAALAACQSVLLLLDDLHRADPASLDLLRVLARDLAILPVLIIVTYRAEEVTRRHPLYQLLPVLVREAHADRYDLQRLDDDAVLALVAGQYPLADHDAARLVAYLQERAEGNPFYLGELLRSLEAEHALHRRADGWAVGDLTRAQIPSLLRQVIDGRLTRLGDDAPPLLAVAAVIGHVVPFGLWATVAGIDETTLLAVVERTAAASLMDETPEGTGARFAHALVREAVYEGIRPSQRRKLHRQVGEALTAPGSVPDPDAVAYHLLQAGDEGAAEWLVRAGERAQRAYAVETAADRYEAACTLMAGAPAPAAQRGWLLYRLALLRRIADPLGSIAYLDEAAALAAASGDRALAAGALFARSFCRANHFGTEEMLTELAAGVDALESLSPDEHARLNEEDGLPTSADSRAWRGSLIFHLALVGRFAAAIAMGEQFLARTTPPTTGGHCGDSPTVVAISAWVSPMR
jgi:predicted ATPase